MVDHAKRGGRGALQASYARAFSELLDALDSDRNQIFAVVRGPKRRVTVRLPEALAQRLRGRLPDLNLKITDFACAAIERHLPPLTGG
jgi:hypothetical protein